MERRAIGYACVAAAVEGELSSRRDVITACCRDQGLTLARIAHDVGASERPALAWALEQRFDVLVVARLRDLANLPTLLAWLDTQGRTLIAVDVGLDTSTERGALAAREFVERTRQLHARIRRRRISVADFPELHERIAAMRGRGMTLQAIADALNADGVPTLRGGALWRPSSVQRACGYRRPSSGARGIELPVQGPPVL
jgi:hypothetical protein